MTYPKIGIRPVIDGRWGGIRESLEAQTMNMAVNAAKLIAAELRYGHVGAELVTLASMLRIPVTMHNVAKENIFRPHAWAAFGTESAESADYRACRQYGPLYR